MSAAAQSGGDPSDGPDLLHLEALRESWRRRGRPTRAWFAARTTALVRQVRDDPAAAEARAANLLVLARDYADDPVLEAYARRALANALLQRGGSAQAVAHYREAKARFEAAGEHLEVARTLSNLVHPCAMVGDIEGATAAYREARAGFERLGEHHRLARLEINLASLQIRGDRFADALETLARAEAGLTGDDVEAHAAILVTRAMVLIYLARFADAGEAFQTARAFALEHGMSAVVAQVDYNLAYLHFLRGESLKAIRALDRARETARAGGDRFHLALCDLDQADVCVRLNLHEDALALAHAAWEQFQQLGMPYEAGKALTNMAEAQQLLGRDAAALDLLARAATCFQAADNEFWVQLVGLYRAMILLKMGRAFEAQPPSRSARECFQRRGLQTKAVLAGIVLARACLECGQLPAARAELEWAGARLAELPAPWLHMQWESALGWLSEAEGRPGAALAAYSRAMDQAEAVRQEINFDELRVAFLRDKAQLYARSLELLVAREAPPGSTAAVAGPPARYIWRQMERTRAQALALRMAAGADPAAEGSRVVAEVNRLREELNGYYRQLDPGQPGAVRESGRLLRDIQAREQQLLRAVRQLPEDGYRAPESLPPGALRALQARLHDTTLVEYFTCGDRFIAAVADAGAVEIVPLSVPRTEVEAALRLLRFQVGRQAMEKEHFRRYAPAFQRATASHLEALHAALVAPLERWLRYERLLVIPHGVLHALPFAALQRDGRALIDDHAVLHAPSAFMYGQCLQRPASPHAAAVVVAPAPDSAPAELAAAHLAGARRLEGSAATLAAVKAAAEECRLLHIAARDRAGTADRPALQLSDGRLNVIDIRHLRLRADLVVISGCATTLGEFAGDQEPLALTRAFLMGGARAVLATLWDQEDATAAEFLADFYGRLGGPVRPAAALRATQLEFRARHPHPYFWAAFQWVGADESMSLAPPPGQAEPHRPV